MSKINLKQSSKMKTILKTFFILYCFYISANLFAWNHDYMQVAYSKAENSLIIRFEFFDYEYGPANENGFLQECDFYFTSPQYYEVYFMGCQAQDQEHDNWSWLTMRDKIRGAKMQFNGCFDPPSGTMWTDDISSQIVKVLDVNNKAYITIKWYLDSNFHDISSIYIMGKWFVNGIWPSELIDENYPVNTASDNLNNRTSFIPDIDSTTVFKPNLVKLSKETDALVIKGVDSGENIRVYSTSGVLIKSVSTNDEVIKIKLPVNQMYIVNIGQTRYKVAL